MAESIFRRKSVARNVSADCVAEDEDFILANAASGSLTVTLPRADLASRVIVKKVDSSVNSVTIATPGSETIDELSTLTLSTQHESFSLLSDDFNWHTTSLSLEKSAATIIVAASDSLHKKRADFVCDGVEHELTIDDCEIAWNSRQGVNVVCTADADNQVGTYSAKMAVQAGAVLGLLATHDFPVLDLSDHSMVSLWIKHSLGCAYGDLVLHLSHTADCGVQLEHINVPALSAGVWTHVYIALGGPSTDTAIISVGIEMKANDPGAFDLFVDDVKEVWNDEVTIQEAVDALPAGGGSVLFLDGTYELQGRGPKGTASTEYGAIRITNSNITLEGQGPNTIFDQRAREYVFHVRGAADDDRIENVIIRNFGFTHHVPEGSVWLQYADKCLIENLWSDGGWDHVSALNSAGFGIYIANSDRNVLKNLHFKNFRIFDIGIEGSDYNNISEVNGITGMQGIYIGYNGEECDYNFVSGVVLDTYDGYGFVLTHAKHNTFLKCSSLHCADYGFLLSSDAISNYLIDCGADYGTRQGIYLLSTGKFNHIIGLKAKFNNRSAIKLYQTHYTEIAECMLDHNDIPDSDHAAIMVSQSTFNYIHNCFITDTEAVKVQKWGIHFRSDAENNQVVHNYVAGNVTGAILDEGINNRYSEQYSDLFMDVLAVSAIHVRSNEDLSAATPITFTIDAQPDVPRTLSGHFDTHANITAYTIAIVGVDAKGNSITETKTEADGWDWETSNAFATITSITMSARTGTGVADTMDIGITDVLGLANIIYTAGDIFKIKKDNANVAVAAAQVNTTYDTYDMSVIGLAAGTDFTIWYKSNLNTIS